MLSFLDLPGEIRNQIYLELLIVPDLATPLLQFGSHPIYPRILEVCQKVHDEAKEILYGINTFLAHPNLLTGLPRLRLHYDTISSESIISLIRRYHIRVRLDCDPNFTAIKVIDAFTDIEELSIEVFQTQYGGSDYNVLRLFEGIRGVKKANIFGSTSSFPKYAEWLQDAMMTPKGIVLKSFNDGSKEDVRLKAPELSVQAYKMFGQLT